MTQLSLDLARGRQRRDAGMDRVEARHGTLLDELRTYARMFALQHGVVHVDDLRTYAADAGLTVSSHTWGVIFRGPGWRKVGERPSAWPSNHGHVSPEWAWEGPRPA